MQIVLLSHLVEDGIVKCEQYWPSEQSAARRYGDVDVSLERTSTFANFVVRSFRVGRHDDADQQRVVTQYQFTAWPDHGVPRHPLALLDFHAKVTAGIYSGGSRAEMPPYPV